MSVVNNIKSSPVRPLTAEAVSPGHPDKTADTISALVVEEHLDNDPFAHVAAETVLTSNGHVILGGEITSAHIVPRKCYEKLARNCIRNLGWSKEVGYDPDSLQVQVLFTSQSPDIAQGIEREDSKKIGAGDQGVTVGFAMRNPYFAFEDDDLLPLPISLSKSLLFAIDQERRQLATSVGKWLKPDMKSQLDLDYGSDGNPTRVRNLVFALSHREGIDSQGIRGLIAPIVGPVFERYGVRSDLDGSIINGTDKFVVAGPIGDTGLTGRKIIVDQFGPEVPVGGGAFHGKDPTKADVTGSYLARWVAKQIVGNNFASQCMVILNWAIGQPEPLQVQLRFGGTEVKPAKQILKLVRDNIDFSLGAAIDRFGMRFPKRSGILYDRLAAWGPYGSLPGTNRPWEAIIPPEKWLSWKTPLN